MGIRICFLIAVLFVNATINAGVSSAATLDDIAQAAFARISRDGDGTPDDKACQNKSLTPKSGAYLKCRKELDASHEFERKWNVKAGADRSRPQDLLAKESANRLPKSTAESYLSDMEYAVSQANGGNVELQYRLCRDSYYGLGVPKSLGDAIGWCLLAKNGGSQKARELIPEISNEIYSKNEITRVNLVRIARAGDGTPDDTFCQKKKLTPSSQAYLTCRQELVADQDTKRQRASAAERDRSLREEFAHSAKLAAEVKRLEPRPLKPSQEPQATQGAKVVADREKARQSELAAEEKRVADAKRLQPKPVQVMEPAKNSLLESLDGAKKQCVTLGFAAGTEGYGKCVLQLSK